MGFEGLKVRVFQGLGVIMMHCQVLSLDESIGLGLCQWALAITAIMEVFLLCHKPQLVQMCKSPVLSSIRMVLAAARRLRAKTCLLCNDRRSPTKTIALSGGVGLSF